MSTQKVKPTIPESLKDHVRDNLYQFVSNLENFASETELDEAQRQYIMLLSAERDLNGIVKEKFTRLPKSPDGKSFNMEIFKKTADDNVLSRAILNQLNKGSSALNAGWDYYALKQSQTTLEVLQGKAPAGKGRHNFGPENLQMIKTVLYPQKGKVEKMDTFGPQTGGVTQSLTQKEISPTLTSSPQTSIEKCVFCGNKGIYFCYDCKSAFCKPCRDTHDKPLPSKKHTVTDLKSVNPSAVKLMCELHKSEFTFYCIPCNTLVCNICITSDHKEHGMSGILEKSAEIKRLAQTQLSDMKDKLQRISRLAEKTKMVNIPKLDEESDDAIARICSIGKELQKIIESKIDMKVDEVQDATHWKKEELQSVLKNKERIYRKQTAVYESLKTLLSEEHAVSFLVSYQTLKRDMCDLTGEAKDDIESHHIQIPDLKGFLDETISSLQEYRKKLK